MKSVLFIIASDPRLSSRPAEAVRIAAGLSAWKKVEVSLYLRGPAALLLQAESGALVDEDNFTRYLPIVRESGRPVYIQASAPIVSESEDPSCQRITDDRLAQLAAEHTQVLRF